MYVLIVNMLAPNKPERR